MKTFSQSTSLFKRVSRQLTCNMSLASSSAAAQSLQLSCLAQSHGCIQPIGVYAGYPVEETSVGNHEVSITLTLSQPQQGPSRQCTNHVLHDKCAAPESARARAVTGAVTVIASNTTCAAIARIGNTVSSCCACINVLHTRCRLPVTHPHSPFFCSALKASAPCDL